MGVISLIEASNSHQQKVRKSATKKPSKKLLRHVFRGAEIPAAIFWPHENWKKNNKSSSLSEKETPTLVYFCEYCEIFKNTFFTHLRWLLQEKHI